MRTLFSGSKSFRLLKFPCSRLRINLFSKESGSFYWAVVSKNQYLSVRCYCHWSFTLRILCTELGIYIYCKSQLMFSIQIMSMGYSSLPPFHIYILFLVPSINLCILCSVLWYLQNSLKLRIQITLPKTKL